MKKRLLSIALALAMLLTLFPAGALAAGYEDELPEGEVQEEVDSSEIDEPEESDLPEIDEPIEGVIELDPETQEILEEFYPDNLILNWYLLYQADPEKLANVLPGTYNNNAGSQLSGATKSVYDQIKTKIEKIAKGELDNTKFTADVTGLGVTADNYEGIVSQVIDALLVDCPYELYWCNKKTTGMQLSGDRNTITISFTVGTEYADKTAADKDHTVDTTLIQGLQDIPRKAQAIVDEYSDKGYSDAAIMNAYRKEICDLTDYNYEAAANSSTYDGVDPWQLIWVFDEKPETKVVCEGYAKAFQYLCDLTTFQNAHCYILSGNMGGPHMWNIVTIEGKSYHVDITNCDSGTAGYPDLLFMKAPTSQDVTAQGSYVFNTNSKIGTTTYTDFVTENKYGIGLTLSGYEFSSLKIKDEGSIPRQTIDYGKPLSSIKITNVSVVNDSNEEISGEWVIEDDRILEANTDTGHYSSGLSATFVPENPEYNVLTISNIELKVNRIAPNITVTTTPERPKAGQEISVTVKITNPEGMTKGFPEQGQVTLTDGTNSIPLIASTDADSNYIGTYTGTYPVPSDAAEESAITLTASVANAKNYLDGTGTATITVAGKTKPEVNLTTTTSTITYGESASLSVTANAAGDVKLMKDGTMVGTKSVTAGTSCTFTVAELNVAGSPYSFTAEFTPTDAANYQNSTSDPVEVKVNKKALTITGLNATSREYAPNDTDVALTGGTLDGIVGNDDVTATTPTQGTIESADAGENKSVTVPNITLGGVDAGNYTLTQPTGITVTIRKKTPEVTVTVTGPFYTSMKLSDVNKTIGGADATNGSFAWDDGDQQLANSAKDYSWTFTPTNTTNYTTKTGTVSITATENALVKIEVTGNPKKTCEYGKPYDTTGTTVTATFANNDTLNVTDAATYAFDNENVGTGRKVIVTYGDKTAEITGIEITPQVIDASQVAWTATIEFIYDGSEKSVAVTGLPGGVTVTYENEKAIYAGTYTATATLATDANHIVSGTVPSLVWEIVAADQTPTLTNATMRTNGATLDLSTLVTGTVEGSVVTFAIPNETLATLSDSTLTSKATEGTVTVTVNIATIDKGGDTKPEYNAYTGTITVTLTDKAAQVINFVDAPVTKTYGDAAFSTTLSGVATNSTVTYLSSDTTIATVSNDGTVTIIGVGSVMITANASETTEVTAGTTNFTFVVAPAKITITANNKSAYVGDAEPTLTYTVEGLVGADQLVTEPTLAYDGTLDMSKAGTISIKASGAVVPNANYDSAIDYVDGTLTITTRPVSGDGSSSSKPYHPSNGGSSSDKDSSKTSSDGTTTTTKTDKNGTVTETTKRPDGSQTVVETKTDGTVTTTEKDSDGTTTKTVENPDGSSQTTLTQPDGTRATTTVDSDGSTESDVRLSKPTVDSSNGDPVALPIPPVRQTTSPDNAPVVTVTVPSASGTIKVEVPVRGATAGTVAVLVSSNGTETVIKASIPSGDGISFSVSGQATVKIIDNSKSFNDVTSGDWHKNAVDFATARGLFNGTSTSTFTPNGMMTRGMIATVLHNLEGNPAPATVSSFSDVSSSAWYANAVSWAAGRGLLSGYGNGSVGAEDPITREQLAVILWKYAGSPAANGSLAFNDASSANDYAQPALVWATQNGILAGSNGSLNPSAQASRAQVAQMLMNFMENVM